MGRRPRLPLGLSDFRTLRRDGFRYVDKTPLIDAVLEAGAQVLLLPRPRRFGKTLNLSMLRHFFERSDEDKRPLFADLAIASSQQAWSHFQRYPTLFVTFKDVKAASWPECFAGICKVLAELYKEHRELLRDGALEPDDARIFQAILEGRATEADCSDALRLLLRLLAQHHGEAVVMLIDEYETPIHAGYVGRYYDQVISFFRTLLSGGLKDNPPSSRASSPASCASPGSQSSPASTTSSSTASSAPSWPPPSASPIPRSGASARISARPTSSTTSAPSTTATSSAASPSTTRGRSSTFWIAPTRSCGRTGWRPAPTS